VTENLVNGAANVWSQHGFQCHRHGLDIGASQVIEEATDSGVVPELEIPGVLDSLIFHQRMRSQVQIFQVFTAGQGSQRELQNQIASRCSVLVTPWWNGSPDSLSHLQVS